VAAQRSGDGRTDLGGVDIAEQEAGLLHVSGAGSRELWHGHHYRPDPPPTATWA
jgi:hypothetical protein